MVKRHKTYLTVAFATLAMGCANQIELDMQSVSNVSYPFIECYCQPGELYNLTATYLSPIDEPQNLDYSYKFEVYITDTERHKLSQSIFYNGNFIYSHGSPERLSEDFNGELMLEVTASNGDYFTASSTIPESIAIKSTVISGSNVVITFDGASDTSQNYILASAISRDIDGKEIECSVKLIMAECSVENSAVLTFEEIGDDVDYIEVYLKRLTADGYKYQNTVLENIESTSSNIINGISLNGNIDGAKGVFTCYTKDYIVLRPNY